jgi:hypothetical protein
LDSKDSCKGQKKQKDSKQTGDFLGWRIDRGKQQTRKIWRLFRSWVGKCLLCPLFSFWRSTRELSEKKRERERKKKKK